MTRTVSITSGKGGVGKTNICLNLALHLSALGYKTCIFDADLGLANINILLGLYPDHTLEDVVLNNQPLSSIIIKDCHGIDIIPGSSGVEQIANIEPLQIENIIKSFSALDEYDYLFFDTSAGISRHVVSFCLASSEVLMVITPEPTSLTDSYALLKILCINGLQSPVKIIINHCKNTAVAKQTYYKFKEVAKKYLSIEVQPLGVILEDPKLPEAVKSQQPFISLFPDTTASKCIKALANNFIKNKTDLLEADTIESFWKRCIGLFKSQLHLKGPAPAADSKDRKPSIQKAELPPESQKPLRLKPAKATDLKPAPETTSYPLDQGFSKQMDNLVDSISSITKELKKLRKVLKNNESINIAAGVSEDGAYISEQPNLEKLDFEKFLQNRTRK